MPNGIAHFACVFFGYSGVEKQWVNVMWVLVDLVPKCVSLQEAVYTYFAAPNC